MIIQRLLCCFFGHRYRLEGVSITGEECEVRKKCALCFKEHAYKQSTGGSAAMAAIINSRRNDGL